MKFAIVIGHDKKAKGAQGVYPINVSEYEYNTEIADMVFRIAKEKGLEAKVFTRDGIGVRGCYKKVEEWVSGESAACVELHFNAFNGKARGTEVLYDLDPKQSQDFAKIVQAALCEVFKRKDKADRGIKLISEPTQRGYTNLNVCKIPSVIVEPFFGDNKEDAALAYSLKKQYATALVDSAIKFLNSLKN